MSALLRLANDADVTKLQRRKMQMKEETRRN
jgi:hypothetical protein